MTQPLSTPVPTSPDTRSSSPPAIVVHVGDGGWRRFFCWIGWLGFLICLAIVVSNRVALREYFDTTNGVQEKYFSGSQTSRDKVAILSVTGAIVEESDFVKAQVERACKDDHVKAVVVRVVSPGGTITGSDYIYHHLQRLRKERQLPVVVSMGSIAASGGYYVSMAVGDQPKSIYAEPTTTTGSIGVIIPHYDLSGLLERFQVKNDSIVSHPRKQMLSMTRTISNEDRQILQSHVNEAFTRFKDIVKEGRPVFRKDTTALDQLATGEIYSAVQAKKHGLVDEIGFIEDAVDRAIELAQLDKEATRVVKYQRTSSLWDLPFLAEAQTRSLDPRTVLDLNAPQAYYLATTLPALISSGKPE